MLAILQYRSCFPKGQQRSIAASDLNVSIPRAVGLPGVMTDTTFTTVHRPIAASDLILILCTKSMYPPLLFHSNLGLKQHILSSVNGHFTLIYKD